MSSPWSSSPKVPPINFGGFKGPPPGFILWGVGAVLAVIVLLSTYFTIDQGERGVVLHWGAVVGEAEPGLHFKLPVITTIQRK